MLPVALAALVSSSASRSNRSSGSSSSSSSSGSSGSSTVAQQQPEPPMVLVCIVVSQSSSCTHCSLRSKLQPIRIVWRRAHTTNIESPRTKSLHFGVESECRAYWLLKPFVVYDWRERFWVTPTVCTFAAVRLQQLHCPTEGGGTETGTVCRCWLMPGFRVQQPCGRNPIC